MKKTKGRTAQARHSRQEGTGTASVSPCPAYALFKSAIQLRVSVRLPRKRGKTDPSQADRHPVGDPGSQTPLHSTATPPRARPARTLGPPTKDVPNALPPHGGALGRMRSGSGSSVAGGEQKGSRPSSTAFPFAKRKARPIQQPCEPRPATTGQRQDAIHRKCLLLPVSGHMLHGAAVPLDNRFAAAPATPFQ